MHVVVLHDELTRAVREVVERVDVYDAGKAFVAALRLRRFEHWSSLASYALAQTLPAHEFSPSGNGRGCSVCGAYRRLDVFPDDAFRNARSRGVVRLDSLRYTLYDLETFRSESIAEPGEPDRAMFDAAMSRIASLRPDAKTFAAEAALATLFPSRADRKLFLGVLGTCGILASPERPGFWPGFVAFEDRASLDPSPYTYPVTWWRRRFGIDRDALKAFGLERYLSVPTVSRIA